PDDISRNFVGVGLGSILASVIGAFAVDASPPSTAIVKESGGRSQFASLTAAALMVALAALAAGLTAYVPHAALSGVLVYIALRILRVDEMIRIYHHSRLEILLVAASAGLVIALPIETGMLLAIVLSFVHSLYIIARPYCVELGRVPGSTVWWPPTGSSQGEHEAGVLVFAPSAPLNFTNAEHICGKIMSAIAAQSTPVKLLVIEANGIIDIDYTGSLTAVGDMPLRKLDSQSAPLPRNLERVTKAKPVCLAQNATQRRVCFQQSEGFSGGVEQVRRPQPAGHRLGAVPRTADADRAERHGLGNWRR